ncbi:hypothetical protein niasHT_006189 [Heterodera trifolii]|uniref:7TM GPCR serpentine receptor class x (Srx) domain-containing protein n=1 Tax=Heterodera trifolii TaxID=157864 RepID=A0ABD2M2D4_9BILA
MPICYAFAVAMFTKPILFSAIYLSWFFNPYVGYTDNFGKIYNNTLNDVHNLIVIFGLFAVIIISLIHSITTVIYTSMQFVQISKIYIIVGTYAWFLTNGCPPLVYLLLNKGIRDDCANFGRAIFRFLRNANNSVSNGSIAMAWMTPNYAGNNANNRNFYNNNLSQQ